MSGISKESEETYMSLAAGGVGFRELKRGFVAVWGKEAVQFLNGLLTNDVAKLEDGMQMAAAFPNAQGRLLAAVRVLRDGEIFVFETEEATAEKVYETLFRFTFAGDFFVEDLSHSLRYFETVNVPEASLPSRYVFRGGVGVGAAVENEATEGFLDALKTSGAIEISREVFELLRIERGIPSYGIDADESTVVPEIGEEGLISYNKGCYIGQEVIARIHFRGHVAKQLRLIEFDCDDVLPGAELISPEGKSAGKVASTSWSPRTGKAVGLAFVRYEFLTDGTELGCGGSRAVVRKPGI